jgi:hypothetical protein
MENDLSANSKRSDAECHLLHSGDFSVLDGRPVFFIAKRKIGKSMRAVSESHRGKNSYAFYPEDSKGTQKNLNQPPSKKGEKPRKKP